jgi:preprotein translocase subunit SecD
MVSYAKAERKNRGLNAPAAWDAAGVLSMYASQLSAQTAIEGWYRTKYLNLKTLQSNAVQLGLDLSGGMSIVLQGNMAAYAEKLGHSPNDAEVEEAMNQALEVLNGRIDRFGLTEPVIRRQGTDQIYIEIPGAADPERINSIVMGKGSLAFHIVDTAGQTAFDSYYTANGADAFNENGTLKDSSILPEGSILVGTYETDEYGIDVRTGYSVLKAEVGLDGNYIQSVTTTTNSITGQPLVTFQLSTEGGDIFYELTSANVGTPMAIVLDERVKATATIQEPIRDSVQLSGFSADAAQNIAVILKSAALPVELTVLNQQSIGASMGEDAIRQGLYALLGGLLAVIVFMLIYYKGAGINAVVAQILNMYLMFSVLSAFNFTLSLSSIAGFILTIGMAVDANVIIFERMKEEMHLGKSRKAVVEAGFNKAFWAIMDSNITTFIAALFLSQLGSGTIQGFAVSLAVGVVSSVFTALFVSRLIFDFRTDVMRAKKLSVSWRVKITEEAAV